MPKKKNDVKRRKAYRQKKDHHRKRGEKGIKRKGLKGGKPQPGTRLLRESRLKTKKTIG